MFRVFEVYLKTNMTSENTFGTKHLCLKTNIFSRLVFSLGPFFNTEILIDEPIDSWWFFWEAFPPPAPYVSYIKVGKSGLLTLKRDAKKRVGLVGQQAKNGGC